jgi:two-component system KDP operon response regulator KdpE
MSRDGAHILVVDDEIEIVRVVQRSLTAYGYNVQSTKSGEEALEMIFRQRPDLIILDLMLPEMSGGEVCQKIRAISNVPIIVLSAKDSERDKIQVLDLGADDYITKPFGIGELLARIRVALRHAAIPQTGTEPLLQIGSLKVDFTLRRVYVDEREVNLSPTEYDLLKMFLTHRGKIVTRSMLLMELWGLDAHTKSHSLHVHMSQLRQKIEPVPAHPRFILTVPGVGYRFNDDVAV